MKWKKTSPLREEKETAAAAEVTWLGEGEWATSLRLECSSSGFVALRLEST